MIRWPSGSAKGARTSSPSSAVYRPGSEGDAPDAASRARTERLLLDAKSAATPRHKLTLMDITAQHIAGHRSHFNPDQPRVPAGNPDGGQWTSAGGGTGSRLAAADKPRLHVGRIPNDVFFHAETTVLLRAAREKGGTLADRTLTVHVDGHLCNRCEAVLPYVGLERGNPTVTFVDPNGSTQTMRDGAWLSSK